MRIFRDIGSLPADARGSIVAIGNFDGVHLGHQSVIRYARRQAASLGCQAAVLTFDPHPRRFFAPRAPRFELTPFRSRVRHLEGTGIASLFALRFDAKLAGLSAETFIHDVLVGQLGVKGVVVGYDFRFGSKRSGDVGLLRREGETEGFQVHAMPPVRSAAGDVYSSTNVRCALEAGRPRKARMLLGRSWGVHGTVAGVDSTGTGTLMHLTLDEYLRPKAGAYAGWVGVETGDLIEWQTCVAYAEDAVRTDAPVFEMHVLASDVHGATVGTALWVTLEELLRPPAADATVPPARRRSNDMSEALRFFAGLTSGEAYPPNVSPAAARRLAKAIS